MAQPADKPPVTVKVAYEYRTIRLDTTKPDATALPTLNDLGAQGWRVADIYRGGGSWRTYLLEREK